MTAPTAFPRHADGYWPWDGNPAAPPPDALAAPPTSGSADEGPATAVLAYLRQRFPALLADPAAAREEELRQAVAQAVAAQAVPQASRQILVDHVLARLIGMGPLEVYLRDPSITEIVVTGPRVFVERGGRFHAAAPLPSADDAAKLAEHLLQRVGRQYRDTEPIQNITWPQGGHRIGIMHHSLSRTGVQIAIRKRMTDTMWDLPGLVGLGMLSADCAADLTAWVRGRLNVLIAGAMGTGKTVFLRALARSAFEPDERIGVLEDTEELRLEQWFPDVVSIVVPATPEEAQATPGRVTIRDAYRQFLRMTIRRLVLGEVRGPEAFDLLESLITDVGGILATIHARRPEELVTRLNWIAYRYGLAIPPDLLRRTAGTGIDVIVQLELDGQGHRHVLRIVESVPDGVPPVLWEWDPAQRTTVRRDTLSDARARWVAHYAATR